jgi:hypothetical protein
MRLRSDGYMSSFQGLSRMGEVNRLVERRSVVGDQYCGTKHCPAIATAPGLLFQGYTFQIAMPPENW